MNICICVKTLNYGMGGVSTHILDLCKQYAKNELIDKVIVCCDGGEHIPTLESIPKVIYKEMPFKQYGMNFKGVWKSYCAMWEAIKIEHIDIVHVHSQRLVLVAQLIKMLHGIPYVWTNHIDLIPNKKVFKVMCALFRFPIISVSQELRNLMLTEFHCSEKRCYVVNNGTDLERLTPLTDDESKALERAYHINREKTPYVICLLSRIVFGKGQMYLLQAINKLEEKSKIKVIFAGHTYPTEANYRKELERFSVENHIDTEYLEYSEPRNVFGISDLFALPSLKEGFPLVVIEALAMGCAVIRSRTPGWQEMQPWTEIVEKGDVDGLAQCIHKVIECGFNKEKTEEGQKVVLKKFTKEVCAANTIEVYEKVIRK